MTPPTLEVEAGDVFAPYVPRSKTLHDPIRRSTFVSMLSMWLSDLSYGPTYLPPTLRPLKEAGFIDAVRNGSSVLQDGI